MFEIYVIPPISMFSHIHCRLCVVQAGLFIPHYSLDAAELN